jgi:hypothetical protein
LLRAVVTLDKRDRALRPQTLRNRSLLLQEVDIVLDKLVRDVDSLNSVDDVVNMLMKIEQDRWIYWQLRRGHEYNNVSTEMSMHLSPHPDATRTCG